MIRFHYQVDEQITLELQSPYHDHELFHLVNDNREFIGQHLTWVHKVNYLKDIQRYMKRDLQGMANARRWAWLIRYEGQAVGKIGLFITMPAIEECELHYFLSKNFTGKGIITKSAKIVTDFAINVLNLKHVLIGFSTQNPKSGAVAERLGFQYEYTMQDSEYHPDGWRSLHFWGILADNWQSTVKPAFDYPINDYITLRLYQSHQCQAKYALLKSNIPEFKKWFWWANNDYSLTYETTIARNNLLRYMQKEALGITIWRDGRLVGNSTLSIDSQNLSGNVGYWLDKSVRGQGIITNTIHALFQEAFTVYGIQRMDILAGVANKGSRAIAERLGMHLDLIQKDETFIDEKFVDHVQYSLLREEWEEKYT